MKKALLCIVLAALSWFAYWAISPLFITVHLDEALPTQTADIATPVTETTTLVPEQKIESPKTKNETQASPGPTPAQPTPAPTSAQPTPAPTQKAAVVGTAGHPAAGTAQIISSGETQYLRYENFSTINGPDLYVYLATDTNATEYINLGALNATEGNINYEIPRGTDLSKYTHALVWCKAFGVLFNSANMQQ